MGYYSDYNGQYDFAAPLNGEQEERLRDYLAETFGAYPDIRYNEGECYCADGTSALYPAEYNMKAYNFNADLAKIVAWCAANDYPALSGEVYRSGADGDDFECISVKDGKVYSQGGEIVYGEPTEVQPQQDN